jgi:hypothetical protein
MKTAAMLSRYHGAFDGGAVAINKQTVESYPAVTKLFCST